MDEADLLRSMRRRQAPDACSACEDGTRAASPSAHADADDAQEADSAASSGEGWGLPLQSRPSSMQLETVQMMALEEAVGADGVHFSGAQLQLLMRDALQGTQRQP